MSGLTASKYCEETPTRRAFTLMSPVAIVPSFIDCTNITDTSSSSARALASSSLSASGNIDVTLSWLVPRVASDLLMPWDAPSTIEVSATIAATPITTPSIVSSDLILVAQILLSASAAVPSNLMRHLARRARLARHAERRALARFLQCLGRG